MHEKPSLVLMELAWKADTCGCNFCPERRDYSLYCEGCEKHVEELVLFCGLADTERRWREYLGLPPFLVETEVVPAPGELTG